LRSLRAFASPRYAAIRRFQRAVGELGVRKQKTIMGKRRLHRSGIKRSFVSIIPKSFRHAGLSLGSNGAVQAAGSRFQRSTINAFGFIQCQRWMNAGFQISDSTDHVSDLFQVFPFPTQTGSASRGNRRKPRISNQALHPTALRAGC